MSGESRLPNQFSTIRFRGEQQNSASRHHRPDFNRRMHAIHLRHAHVADEKIRTPSPRPLHRFSASIRHAGFVSVLRQDQRKRVGYQPVIVRDQDFLPLSA